MTEAFPSPATVPTSAVVAFIRRHAPKGPGAWPTNQIDGWLSSRADRGEMHLIVDGPKVVALGVCTESGDGLHVELLIGRRRYWASMLAALQARWPDWARRRCTAVRRGKHRRFNLARLVQRMEDDHGR